MSSLFHPEVKVTGAAIASKSAEPTFSSERTRPSLIHARRGEEVVTAKTAAREEAL